MKTVDILGANRFDNYTKTREGSRAIIIHDGKILLDVPGKDDFEQNTHNLYTISGENLGELTSVVLSHNSSGKDPGLCVDTVKITDQSTGEEYWANCRKISDGWIEKEKKLSVEYPLEKRK